MSQKIGYQDGIDWFVAFTRKIPGVRWRPVGERPVSLEQWYGLEKFERTLRILKDDHDATIVTPPNLPPDPPPDPPKPPTTYVRVAPRVAYKDWGSDARYCTLNQPGVVAEPGAPSGHTIDEHGATYDDNGLCKNGRRSDGDASNTVTSARNIDGRPYCSLPTTGDPTKNTGSWTI